MLLLLLQQTLSLIHINVNFQIRLLIVHTGLSLSLPDIEVALDKYIKRQGSYRRHRSLYPSHTSLLLLCRKGDGLSDLIICYEGCGCLAKKVDFPIDALVCRVRSKCTHACIQTHIMYNVILFSTTVTVSVEWSYIKWVVINLATQYPQV
jgi:hypothetical protein